MNRDNQAQGVVVASDEATQIEQLMQSGYKAWRADQPVAACHSWQKVWPLVMTLLRQNPAASVEDIAAALHGHESLTAWARDYEAALGQAGQEDASYHELRVAFCRQYLARTIAPGSLDNLNLQRAIGESLFRLGRPEEGETAFQALTRGYPRYGWGWIGWADQYLRRTADPWHNPERAAAILRQALAESAVSSRPEIVRRLRDILIQLGRPTEATLVE
jgi:hypothetical protein